MIGQAFRCQGPCGLKWHLGLGKDCYNCNADMLVTPCERGSQAKEAPKPYKFGDLAQQVGRDLKQGVKDIVLDLAVQEQKEHGKFDELKSQCEFVRGWWDYPRVTGMLMQWQMASVILSFAFGFLLVQFFAWTVNHASGLGLLVGASVGASLLLVEIALAFLVEWIAAHTLQNSAVVHAFVHEILHIDLQELNLNLDDVAGAVRDVSRHTKVFSCAVLAVVFVVWVLAVNSSCAVAS